MTRLMSGMYVDFVSLKGMVNKENHDVYVANTDKRKIGIYGSSLT